MQYLTITNEMKSAAMHAAVLDKAPRYSKAATSTTYFARNFLGIKPYTWQHYFWGKLESGTKRLCAITPRQVGKSTAIGIFALRAALFNLYPAGVNQKTVISIISRSDQQSKEMMKDIRSYIYMGDEYIKKMSGGTESNFISQFIDTSTEASNNMTTITFTNGCVINCRPPTDAVRGDSNSILFLDEAAHITEDSFYYEVAYATVRQTKGMIVITTTPKGMQGFVYDLFDPEEKYESHEYDRIWLHYTMIDSPDEIAEIENTKRQWYELGKEKKFQQEFEAKFTSQVGAFFDSADIDAIINPDLKPLHACDGETYMGVDFGMVNSHTVITIVAKIENKVRLLYQFSYSAGQDHDLIRDMDNLLKRFSCHYIIVDDCPQGYYAISEMEKKNWPVQKMSFRAEKVAKYFSFRSMIRKKLIEIYKNDILISEMKAMQEIQTPATVKIEKPDGGNDDRVDSLLMACYFFIDDESVGGSVITNPVVQVMTSSKDPRADTQWAMLQLQSTRLQEQIRRK